ncbi:riboflavin biosynthesis protein RibD [Candidatus Peribacteria bacterium RIFCSPHIGHO2_02_FULL_52_16]|nr:MAG: riboflavin biosynthesis protein RibD [Candidatus Peribacteria bacterium RIFCSPHIGHO2_01_FULL_51_35]OGJ60636.1 MAG: riboflavin biosynthesis protein RibD [Candidatus Peribacteria bacterium RIFCSPHIGHO2_02_FULL_52_16]
MNHEHFMHRCLELAEEGRGFVGNGALVGSFLVRDGKVKAEASHKKFGNNHSERELLEKFDQEIYSEDILYVNLEPCCHTGKTPPCTDIILERGIKNVVFGMMDPDPRVSGKGIEILKAKGVNIIGPVLRAECERLNRGYINLRTKGRPWITLKKAQARDGSIAKPDGSPLKITSKEQDAWSHEWLRAKHDAILVGVGTITNDNPRLTLHELNKKFVQPYRIILDRSVRIPEASNVLCDEHRARTIVIISDKSATSDYAKALKEKGIRLEGIPMEGSNFSWDHLWKVLTTPKEDFFGITSLLVEGGSKTWEAFHSSGFIDEDVLLLG